MSSVYLVVKDLNAHACNVSTSYMTNAFPVSSVIGLGDAFRYWLSEQDPQQHDWISELDGQSKTQAFAIIKRYSPQLGKKAFPAYYSQGGGAHKNISPSELQLNETLANIQATLVYKLSVDEDFESLHEIKQSLGLFLKKARFAGGKIANLQNLEIEAVDSISALHKCLDREKGWVVNVAYHKLTELMNHDDIIEAVKDLSFTFIDQDSDNNKRYYKKYKGWLLWNLQGYQYLESPQKRGGSRNGHPHVFAEPVINLNEVTFYRPNGSANLFWKWKEHENAIELVQS
jgi:hypothetical protein